MRHLKTALALTAVLLLFSVLPACAAGYNFQEFMKTNWIRDPQISPNGKKILFSMENKDLKTNKIYSSLWTVDTATGELHRFTDEKGRAMEGRWSPNGKHIAFTSVTDGLGQIWLMPSQGGKATKLTDFVNGASGPVWSPDSTRLLFVSDVYQGCRTEAENRRRKEAEEKKPHSGKLITSIPYQVFDHWRDGKNSHLFILNLADRKAFDLTPGNYDIPPIDLGTAHDYGFSPDGHEVCFVTNKDKNLAWSTNNDLFTVPAAGGTAKKITDNPGNDSGVRYSPDGKYIAYTQMKRPGFEADMRVLMLYDRSTGKSRPLTEKLDRPAGEFLWTADGKSLIVAGDDGGYKSVYEISADGGAPVHRQITKGTHNSKIQISPDGTALYVIRESMTQAPELYRIDRSGGREKALTSLNERIPLAGLSKAEEFWFTASDGVRVQGFLLKPPGFDAKKKYGVIYLIHGGPQSAWSDDFHQRWNTALFSAMGYVTMTVNFRGSTGYGQEFTDAISKNWGGRPYEDVMEGLDYAVKTYKFIDENRVAAVGASYGGYMVNWIMGHTDRFKCAVSLSGVFNTVSEYGTTEELWFPEWEFGGTPYDNRELYEKWNPVNYVKNFKTPCLVIHGEEDYRVPVSESKQLFTALQRNGVPSQFLYFPDECHFVRKPQNMKIWYETMEGWFKKWLGN